MAREHFESLLQEALALSPEDRLTLAEDLYRSLRTAEEQTIAAEWDAEALRRWEEIERGEVETIPWEETLERARAALNDARRITSGR
jgi:putative addiction module component (TIGR02574 family)